MSETSQKERLFAASEAYPPICAAGENRAYARAMLDNVG